MIVDPLSKVRLISIKINECQVLRLLGFVDSLIISINLTLIIAFLVEYFGVRLRRRNFINQTITGKVRPCVFVG